VHLENDTTSSGTPEDRLRVIVADDDPFARHLLKGTLRAAGIIVIAEASDGKQAVELALYYRPDVVLMDVTMPGVDGITASRRVVAKRPDQRVILLTRSEDEELALLGLHSGAVGYLSKDVSTEGLVRALHAVARGEAVIPRALSMRLIEQLRSAPQRLAGMRPVVSPLTNREWQIVDLFAERRSTAEIADTLYVTPATVRSHTKSILRKLDVGSRGEAVERADEMRRRTR
jgi:NarL family two-component system response regulator LiaR